MSVATMQVVTDDLREQAWKLYREAFDPLRQTAVQRHVMYDDEFDAVMADARVDKYLIYNEEGTLQGLGTITNKIESMPLVSPEYFAARWPGRFAEGRVYYIGFVGVHPSAHGSGIFGELVHAMTSMVAACDGVAVLDVCRHNHKKLHLPRMISILASTWAPHVEMVDLDAQTYIGYDFMRAG
jgi:acetyltransferase (GNAT) family protein